MYFFILSSPLLVASFLIAAIIVLLFGNLTVSALLIGAAIIVNYKTESFALNFRSKQRNNEGQSFKILTYNLNRAYSTSVNKGTEQKVLDVIKAQNADIVLLQEFNPYLYKTISDGLTLLYPYGSQDAEGSRFKSVFSRYPIDEYEQLTTGTEVHPICSMRVLIGGIKYRIVNCHLMSNNFSIVYRDYLKGNGRMLTGLRKAFELVKQGYKKRQEQAEMLIGYLQKYEEPVLICGDFNEVGGAKTLNLFRKKGLVDTWWKIGHGFGFTYKGLNMRFRLDHILYGKTQLKPIDIRVIDANASDHLPLLASFSIR